MIPTEEDRLCALGLVCDSDIGPVTLRRLMQGARKRETALSKVLRWPAEALVEDLGFKPETARAVRALTRPASSGQAMMDRLASTGIRAVFEGEPDYPDRLSASLGEAAPVAMFFFGEPGVLAGRTVAVVGSREPSEAAADAAAALVPEFSRGGMTVVSGGAPGIDTIAQREAIRIGRMAVIPACGIARFHWRDVGEEDLFAANWCLAGQVPPWDAWRTKSALMRNRVIVALSDAVVAFDPRDRGGTWHGARAAIDMEKPLFVVCGNAHEANARGLRRLVRRGAVALDPACMPRRGEFERMLKEFRLPPRASQSQLPHPGDD